MTTVDQVPPVTLPDRRARHRPGSGQWARALHVMLLFLTMAGIAHILTTLLIPRYAVHDSASVFLSYGADGRSELVSADGERNVRIIDADALSTIAICGFDLADGPLRINVRTGQMPLALSLHVRGGGVFYAVTDKAAQRGMIEFVVLDRQQYEERVAKDDDGDSQRELRVISPARQGIVLARALVKQPSDRAGAEALVKGMACGAAG